MNEGTKPDMPAASWDKDHVHEPHSCASACMIDPDTFNEFIDLMGQKQARLWLDEFRDGLMDEFPHSPEENRDAAHSRENIHRFCGRAGFMGFKALHDACIYFLECDAEHDVSDAAYAGVRAQANLAISEIERQCGLLT